MEKKSAKIRTHLRQLGLPAGRICDAEISLNLYNCVLKHMSYGMGEEDGIADPLHLVKLEYADGSGWGADFSF